MSIFTPAIVGFLLGAPALAGLLLGALTSGFMLAVTMANAGGAWDNAKKYCEKGGLGDGKGKGTANHAATVVGDTVGDPFKDTSGPSLNILIKLMSIVSLVLAPLFRTCCQTEFGDDGIIAGIVLLTLTVGLCAVVAVWTEKSMSAFKASVEAKKAAIKDGNNGSAKKAKSAALVPANETSAATNAK